jgi:hypothetical protein
MSVTAAISKAQRDVSDVYGSGAYTYTVYDESARAHREAGTYPTRDRARRARKWAVIQCAVQDVCGVSDHVESAIWREEQGEQIGASVSVREAVTAIVERVESRGA